MKDVGSRLAAAIDRLITVERLWVYPLATLAIGVLTFGATILLGDYPHVFGGAIAFPDYLAHWTGARMLLDGDTNQLYDPMVQRAVQDHAVAPDALSWFISPPFVTLMYAPFGLLNYGVSAIVWTVVSICFLVASIRLARPIAPTLFSHHFALVVLLLMATQPVFEVVGSGQDSGLSLLIWVGGIRLMLAGRDVPAGVVFALGLFKPQQFVLVPIVLLLQRRFRALAAWLATASILGIVSVAVVGVEGVINWLRLPSSDFYDATVHVAQAWKMQSVPAFVTTVFPSGWSRVTSTIGLMVMVIAVIVFIRQILRSRRAAIPDLAVWMLAMLATVTLSPHLFIYDLVLALVPILYLVEHHNTRTVRLSCVALFVLTWTAPLRHVVAMDSPWPLSLVESAWTAVPLVILWVALARALRLVRVPDRIDVPGSSATSPPEAVR